ncbi:class III signal peptide-containing protein [Thermococcus sp. Bubb.Bath]|uniref:class III signal peptide-containing protein n=1 Tax=Thermococcus sp. Bubb.Bath TaxID=1638242 RepID=UPI00143A7F43|nr:class III signal peptide-containing protein [Thermococcus sp. Bubb.Bath]NJF24116.1 class III signal peptide-containing protein [Thermococcus sp. Bubb.Bath]
MVEVRGYRRAQSAIEYLFMLAAALILVAIALKAVMDSTKYLEKNVSDYTSVVRKKVLENL